MGTYIKNGLRKARRDSVRKGNEQVKKIFKNMHNIQNIVELASVFLQANTQLELRDSDYQKIVRQLNESLGFNTLAEEQVITASIIIQNKHKEFKELELKKDVEEVNP